MISFTTKKTDNGLIRVRLHTRGPVWGHKITLNEFFLTKGEARALKNKLEKLCH